MRRRRHPLTRLFPDGTPLQNRLLAAPPAKDYRRSAPCLRVASRASCQSGSWAPVQEPAHNPRTGCSRWAGRLCRRLHGAPAGGSCRAAADDTPLAPIDGGAPHGARRDPGLTNLAAGCARSRTGLRRRGRPFPPLLGKVLPGASICSTWRRHTLPSAASSCRLTTGSCGWRTRQVPRAPHDAPIKPVPRTP
jgi:hypothetical protein